MLTMLCFASRPLTVQELINSIAVETGKAAGLNRRRRLLDSNGIREIYGGLVNIFFDNVEDEDVSEDEYSSEDGDASEDGDTSEDGDASEDGEASVEIPHSPPPARIVPTARIAHFSVQEYLESKRISGQKAASFGLSSITTHAEIAEVCLIYLLEPGLSRSELNQALLEEYPLAEFAATYWYYHYTRAENPTSRLDTCILRLFQSQTLFATWVRLHDVEKADGPDFCIPYNKNHSRQQELIPTPIYFASLLGLDKVLHELLRFEQVESTKMSAPSLTTSPKASKQIISWAGGHGGAMQAASYHGNDHIIQILLDSGFDVNDQGVWPDGSAIQLASSQGHAKVVQILLDRGADVNAQSRWYGSALKAASGGGFKEIVQILLDRGADVNTHHIQHSHALTAASYGGHKEVVQILLNRGADINAQSEACGSALQNASGFGHKEVVQMLVDRGADVNVQAGGFDTALWRASEGGCGNIVQMLLDSGARVSIGCTSRAFAAVRKGHSDIVQMLLNNMNAEDFDNEWKEALLSPLQSDKKIIRLLETHDFPFRHKPPVTEEA